MRSLILALASPLLLAQAHYEGGTLIAPLQQERTMRLRNITETVETLTFQKDGRSRTLVLPPELDGHAGRCIQISHFQGTTYAVGLVHPPIPPGRAGRTAMGSAYFQSGRRLYACGPDGRWTGLAYLPRDTSHQRWTLVPLGGNRFLYGHGGMAWQGEAVSPFGIYRAEGGELVLERLLDLGLGGPWYRAHPQAPTLTPAYQELKGRASVWEVRRVPAGLCLVHTRSLQWFLMDEAARTCRARGRLAPGGTQVAAVAVRPDGRLLVALRQGDPEARFRALVQGPNIYQSRQRQDLKPAEQLALARAEAMEPPGIYTIHQDFAWQVLDPVLGTTHPVPAPRAFSLFAPFPGFLAPALTVLPDGRLHQQEDERLHWSRPKAIRFDWLDRILQPFTHHWKKLMP